MSLIVNTGWFWTFGQSFRYPLIWFFSFDSELYPPNFSSLPVTVVPYWQTVKHAWA